MCMIQPHSGAGKGFYFIPEIGEEVLVGFEGNNAQNPYVLGSQYNGSESSGYADGENNLKAIHTRSGTKIAFNDSEGSILIEDPSGNTWMMDGQGNISVNAPNTFSINATDINLTASKNISTSAGMNIVESAGGDKTTMVGMMHSLSVGVDYMINVTGKLFEIVTGERKSQAKKVINNHESHEMNIEKDKKIHTEGKFEVNSTDKSNMF
ncbi:phage baseplate assembly protein V [Flavobacterium sp. PL002]|uniref:phage baseplate assembly protein V n=1 Tax=Flavobacterium sp. PL002 TaxID=1897058 RepID=UPI001787E186